MAFLSKVAIVTGGASGVGRATALLLARGGATVMIADIDEKGALAVANGAAAEGLKLEYLPLDLTRVETIRAFAERFHALYPRADILINAAGWNPQRTPFAQSDGETWEREIWINLMGAIHLTRQLLPPMIAASTGKIVNISSDAGRIGSTGVVVYSAAKAGVIGFTRALAAEMARHKINVNCISPGPVDTPLFHSATPEKLVEPTLRAIPMRRLGRPEELAEAIVFFASERADYITGQILSVNGGLNML